MTQAILCGVEHYLPPDSLTNDELSQDFPEWSVDKIASKTGIEERRVVSTECASDLATAAAKTLLSNHPDWAECVDALILCTQSPDYLLPTSACLIQDRLQLPTRIAAFDMNLGCSGYIYGLGIAKGLIETEQARGVLLLNADTYTRLIHPRDKSVRTLFGDAGTATFMAANQQLEEAPSLGPFVYGTDGSGGENLIVPDGGFRNPIAESSQISQSDHNGNVRSPSNLYMNGAEVFAFSLKRVPGLVRKTLQKASLDVEDIDYFVFHQANQFMLDTLRKKCKIPSERFVIRVRHTGNTVSASIPLVLSQMNSEGLLRPGLRLMLVGFGVGYSWGATIIRWTSD